MTRTSTALKRLGVAVVAVATMGAGVPALVGTAASAATTGAFTVTENSGESNTANNCINFTVSTGATQAATPTVTITVTPKTTPSEFRFCEPTGGTTGANGTKSIAVSVSAEGTATFGIISSSGGTFDITARGSTGGQSNTLTVTIAQPACDANKPPTITLDRGDAYILNGERSFATLSGTPGDTVQVVGYSRPSKTVVAIHSAKVLPADGVLRDSFIPPTNSRLFLRSVGANRCGTSAGVVINVHARIQIAVNHIRGAHKILVTGRFFPRPTSTTTSSTYGPRKIELYEQPVGQPSVRLAVKNITARDFTFTYTFLRTKNTRLFLRSPGDYRNLSGESPKLATSTY